MDNINAKYKNKDQDIENPGRNVDESTVQAIIVTLFSIAVLYALVKYAHDYPEMISRKFFVGNLSGGVLILLLSHFVLNKRPHIYHEYNSQFSAFLLKVNRLLGILLIFVSPIGIISPKAGLALYSLITPS